MADVNDSNRLENLMGEDVDPKWNEPSTRGDLRLLAIRIDTKFDQVRNDFHIYANGIDTKFDQVRNDFHIYANGIDTKFDQLRSDFRIFENGIDSKFDVFRAETTRGTIRIGMIFFGAIMTANLSMLGIFAALVK